MTLIDISVNIICDVDPKRWTAKRLNPLRFYPYWLEKLFLASFVCIFGLADSLIVRLIAECKVAGIITAGKDKHC
jgi:hypothetical protein